MSRIAKIIAIHVIILGALILFDYPFGQWFYGDVQRYIQRGTTQQLSDVRVEEGEQFLLRMTTNDVAVLEETIVADAPTRLRLHEATRRTYTRRQRMVFTLLRNDAWVFFEQFGLVFAGFIFAVFIWYYHPAYRKYILHFLIASILTGLIVVFVKDLTGKMRPGLTGGVVTYVRFLRGFRTSGMCFPSGHTTQVFVLATWLAILYPKLRVFFYVCASITGISRVVTMAHWPSDVYAGAVLGYAITQGVFRWSAPVENVITRLYVRYIRPLFPPPRVHVGSPAPPLTDADGVDHLARVKETMPDAYCAVCFLTETHSPESRLQLDTLSAAEPSLREQKIALIAVTGQPYENSGTLPCVYDEDRARMRAYSCAVVRFGRPRAYTYIIAPDGTIAYIFTRVNPAAHDKEIVGAVVTCKSAPVAAE